MQKLVAGFTARTTTDTGGEWLLGERWSAAGEKRKDVLFSKDELNRLTIPIGLRSLDDIKAPFIQSGYCADLRLQHLDLVRVSDLIGRSLRGAATKRHSPSVMRI